MNTVSYVTTVRAGQFPPGSGFPFVGWVSVSRRCRRRRGAAPGPVGVTGPAAAARPALQSARGDRPPVKVPPRRRRSPDMAAVRPTVGRRRPARCWGGAQEPAEAVVCHLPAASVSRPLRALWRQVHRARHHPCRSPRASSTGWGRRPVHVSASQPARRQPERRAVRRARGAVDPAAPVAGQRHPARTLSRLSTAAPGQPPRTSRAGRARRCRAGAPLPAG